MNQIQISILRVTIGAVALLMATAAFAGGVSDGGGGTTNPNPIEPMMVEGAVLRGEPILLLWLNQEELFYNLVRKTPNSPFTKLFDQPRDIFNALQSTAIEVRYDRPCYDRESKPWDGSVYASTPGAVCISACEPLWNKFQSFQGISLVRVSSSLQLSGYSTLMSSYPALRAHFPVFPG